jgi:hypothetical protein
MKLALITLLATSAAAQCSSKAGTIAAITPLTNAWKLYNFQVASNAQVDSRIANRTADSAVKEAALTQAGVDKQAELITIRDASLASITVGYDAQVARLAAKLLARTTAIGQKFDAKVNAIAVAAGLKDVAATELIGEIQANATVFTAANQAKLLKVQTKASTKKTSLAANLATSLAKVTATKAQAHSDIDAKELTIQAKYASKAAQEHLDVDAKYAAIDANLESTKFDTAATLATIDAAAGYPEDYCLISAADVITGVKAEHSRNAIWNTHINGGE